MFFFADALDKLERDRYEVITMLNELQQKIIIEAQSLDPSSRVYEHLLHGAGRRVRVIRRSIENVFSLFPPSTAQPLNSDVLDDVQINLHAFLINIYGLYDNWAWAYVLRHDLKSLISNRHKVGLFNEATQRHLPDQLRTFLSSPVTIAWHKSYAKSFRDALAHRIPPYIPSAELTPEEKCHFNELHAEILECTKNLNLERLEEVLVEQGTLGSPSFTFLHAFTEDEPPRPLLLHPQLLSDGMFIADFGHLFLQCWHEIA
ncbi:MAG: hypothetical protein HQK72_00610 [Desulfamplus sp.]|nr:hypothetical protein [Desulfamplus sp.]